jgi:hypothetical protein
MLGTTALGTFSLFTNTIYEAMTIALGVLRASLLGLPAELRLEIFSYLSEPLRFHVDSAGQDLDPRKWNFTHKRLCYTSDLVYPSLCITPCFSGLIPHDSLCQNLGGKLTHRLAIRGVCKLFQRETKSVLNKNLFSLTLADHMHEARGVLKSMSSQRLEMLVELTTQVLPDGRHRGWGDVSPVIIHLRHHHTAFPNLRTIAIQAPQRFRKLSHSQVEPVYFFDPEGEWRWQWPIVELKKTFQNRAQIIFEGWIVPRAGHALCSGATDEMMRVRGVVATVLLNRVANVHLNLLQNPSSNILDRGSSIGGRTPWDSIAHTQSRGDGHTIRAES